MASHRFPFFPVRFLHGNLVPGSAFERQVLEDSQLEFGATHPEPIQIYQSLDGLDNIERLVYAGHSAQQLTQTLKDFVERRGTSLGQSQVAAIHQFHLVNMGLENNPYQRLEHDNLILEYFNVFNSIFFFGSLRDLVKVEFKQLYRFQNPPASGYCTTRLQNPAFRREIPNNFAALIEIADISPVSGWLFRNDRLANYLGTLLHEMLHAYFGIFLCDCSAECHVSFSSAIGTSGHGSMWHDAALAIEQATFPLLGVGLNLMLNSGMMREYGQDYPRTAPRDLPLAVER